MGAERFERNLSEKSKKVLRSETWQKAGKAIKTEIQHFTEAPEIQHFATVKVNKNDNVYGIVWGEVVREYLKTVYPGENAQTEIVSDGIIYKAHNRGDVTAFYDSDGNTLFDVENKRLEKEYGYVMQEDKMISGSEMESDNAAETGDKNMSSGTEESDPETGGFQAEKKEEKPGSDVPADSIALPGPASVKQMAKEKLEKELKADKDKTFAEPVIGYLLKRCEEDLGLARDVVQVHKTWQKCFDYIYSQARKQTKGNCAAVRDDVVYEWAEDYYHKDDKAEEEKKAQKAAKDKTKKAASDSTKKAKSAEERKAVRAKNTADKAEKVPAPSKAEAPKEPPKPKRNGKEMDGQLDMFAMMGM